MPEMDAADDICGAVAMNAVAVANNKTILRMGDLLLRKSLLGVFSRNLGVPPS
jgi:hypothetical protein